MSVCMRSSIVDWWYTTNLPALNSRLKLLFLHRSTPLKPTDGLATTSFAECFYLIFWVLFFLSALKQWQYRKRCSISIFNNRLTEAAAQWTIVRSVCMENGLNVFTFFWVLLFCCLFLFLSFFISFSREGKEASTHRSEKERSDIYLSGKN